MPFPVRRARSLALSLLAFAPFTACHLAGAAEAPKTVTPTVDFEIEDKGPSPHVARYSLVVVDGRAQIVTRDADAKVDIEVKALTTAEPRLSLQVRRVERAAELDVSSAIAQRPGARVLVARIDRPDGHTTTITAQVR